MRKIHIILGETGYVLRDDFPQIAKYVVNLRKERKIQDEITLLKMVEEKFGTPPEMIKFAEKPKRFAMFGVPNVDIDSGSLDQMKKVMRLPVVKSGALMADAHQGYVMPIGGVAALDKAVSPSMVGYDIACRMTLTIIKSMTPKYARSERKNLLKSIIDVTHFGMGRANFISGKKRDHPVMDDPRWKEIHILRNQKATALNQLGSSGGGNHFVDLVIGKIDQDVDWLPLNVGDEFVGLLSHSGSRGAGNTLAKHYMQLAVKETKLIAKGVPRGYEWLSIERDTGREYMTVMNLMGDYAQANHHLIHDQFLKRIRAKSLVRLENHHNFAWLQSNDSVIHRKGATPAEKGQAGLIPGSSASPSYIVEGLGNPEGLWSSSHGAGRVCSRQKAKESYDKELVKLTYEEADVLIHNVGKDENPYAYKDIKRVMELQEGQLIRSVATMQPIVVVMSSGRSDEGN